MARAPPSAPWLPSKRWSMSWPPRTYRSSRLDIFAQRFLLVFVFPHAPFDDVADRNQADQPLALDNRQMPEFSKRHRLHDRGHRIGWFAADYFARHDRADRLVEDGSSPLAERAHNVTLRQDAFDPPHAHHQDGTDPALDQGCDGRRKFLLRRDALDVVTLGVENGAYRHLSPP